STGSITLSTTLIWTMWTTGPPPARSLRITPPPRLSASPTTILQTWSRPIFPASVTRRFYRRLSTAEFSIWSAIRQALDKAIRRPILASLTSTSHPSSRSHVIPTTSSSTLPVRTIGPLSTTVSIQSSGTTTLRYWTTSATHSW